ncbi:MAG TPA: hypothetical protein VFE32_05560 [Puia sp.]|jgi:predicted small secreted protein|nr:hypothetical protein [Puia sp.]
MQANWTTITILLTATGVLLVAASLSLAGCAGMRGNKRDLDLLTNTPWKYEKAGFDSNDDGIFDALDPRIAGSEKDNTIIFCKDGTGTINSLPFIWAFQNGDSTIYFQDQYYRVRTLNKQRLEIYADEKWGGVNTRYIIILKH